MRKSRDLDTSYAAFPYTRPEVKTFLERLAGQYRRACGERLVVTSMTRPKSRQPANASRHSVHPTGMAIDLRKSRRARCSSWLERVLIQLERRGILEATRERYPPHYHVAVFPKLYERYVAQLTEKLGKARVAKSKDRGSQAWASVATAHAVVNRVRHGQSLWSIARRYETSVRNIQRANDLSKSRIYPGQMLRIPANLSGS